MKFWRRPAAIEPRVDAVQPPPVSSLAWEFGDQYCSARGCTQKTGLACSYIDRRQRPCPTAWCPQHRTITHGSVFCSTHGRLLEGAADEFREEIRIDLENLVPVVLGWIVQEFDAEVSMAMLDIAMEWQQALVLDPVHFVFVGINRVRSWERAWKVCDNLGPTLRVALVIEEANPGVVEARINARPVVSLTVPWHESHGYGPPPATLAEARGAVFEFRERLLAALIRGIAEWRRDNLGNRELAQTNLRGFAWASVDPTTPKAPSHSG